MFNKLEKSQHSKLLYKCTATPSAYPSRDIACNYRVNSNSVVYRTSYFAHLAACVGAIVVQQQTDRRSNVERPKSISSWRSSRVVSCSLRFSLWKTEPKLIVAGALFCTRTKSRHCAILSGNCERRARDQSSNRGGPNMSVVFKFVVAAGVFFVLVVLCSVAIYSAWSVALNDGIARRVPAFPHRP